MSKDGVDALRAWANYGQKGQPSAHRVGPNDWNAKAFITPITSPWKATIAPKDLPKLLNGFKPGEMEDKWFVYADGPDANGDAVVHFHRSWTGLKVVALKIKIPLDEDGEVEETDSLVTDVIWESDGNGIRGPSLDTAKKSAKDVCSWVLDVKVKE